MHADGVVRTENAAGLGPATTIKDICFEVMKIQSYKRGLTTKFRNTLLKLFPAIYQSHKAATSIK